MEENLKNSEQERRGEETEIIRNDYGATRDSAVVVEEDDRTVLLTGEETVVIEKSPTVDVVPKNRPRKVYAGMWGKVEIATVGVALLAVLTSVLLFVFLVIPAEKELEENRARRDQIERELIAAREKYGSITRTEEHVAKIKQSVKDFEDRYLPNAAVGKTALYQRINGLIAAYGLINTTGPDYAPLEVDMRQAADVSSTESGKSKFQSLFPGDYVTMTVEGSYQNLRRFIRDIETSEQFVIISAVELEPAEGENKNRTQTTQTDSNQPNQPNQQTMMTDQYGRVIQTGPYPGMTQPNQPPLQQTAPARVDRGKMHGETVSLRIELAAYFRRPASPAFEPVRTGAERQ
jgi:Tfp pilus assembly protein PilO